jgi:branched-chain amino acid transport system permease protein
MTAVIETLRKNRVLFIILAIIVVLFLMAIQGMSAKDWVITTLRGLSVGAVTFLVAAGFSIILGLMDVLNLAQAALFMLGAYIGWSVYVRPDTFVDVLTPLTLLLAGLALKPVWGNLLGRSSLPPLAARIWPWMGLILALVILALAAARVPVAIWDAEVYDDSPIIWTQSFESGQAKSLLQPAQSDTSPVISLGGILLGSVLVAASLAGLARRSSVRQSQGLPRGAVFAFLFLVIFGIGIYLLNDDLTGSLFDLDTTWLFLIAVVVSTLAVATLGGLMEATLIRPLYANPLYQIMLTFGLSFIGVELVRTIWGRNGFTMPRPSIFAGSGDGCPATSLGGWLEHKCSTLAISIGGEVARIRVYNEIFIVLVGLIVLVVVWILIQRTRLGMIIRAGVQDSEMVEALGINVRRIFTLVFALGVALAGLGGVLYGPSTGLSNGMGGNLLLKVLIALAIGGLTSYPGAALGSVLVGLVEQFIIKYGQIGINLPFMDTPFKPTPPLVPASTVLLMIIILLAMPQGLLGRKE